MNTLNIYGRRRWLFHTRSRRQTHPELAEAASQWRMQTDVLNVPQFCKRNTVEPLSVASDVNKARQESRAIARTPRDGAIIVRDAYVI